MRAAKTLIGVLCVLSLSASIGLFIYGQYIPSVPFRRGATAYELPRPDTFAIARLLGGNGIEDTDAQALQRFVEQQVDPQRVLRGTRAAFEIARDLDYKPSTSRSNVAAAAILDADGRVVKAYPKSLIGKAFPFGEPISQIRNSLDRDEYGGYNQESVSAIYPYWTNLFRNAVHQHVDDVEDIMLQRLENARGETVGILAVAVPNLQGIDLPPGVTLPNLEMVAVLNQFAIGALIAYLLLLPFWVGLDAQWRGMRPFAWASLVAITNVIGFGAYMVARLPAPYPCANCGEEVLGKYVRCPACGVSLMNACPICRTKMKPNWQYCPVCNVTASQALSSVSASQAVEQTTPSAPPEPLVSRLMEHMRASLTVSVLDAQSGTPMQNARVSVVGRMSKVDGITNAAGIFEARKLRTGRYTVTVTRAGYEPAEAELDVTEAPESVRLSLRALPAKIIGRVVERGTSRPIAGVRVYLDSSRLDRSSITGGEGGFVLADVPAGPYTVAVDAVGFKHQTRLAEVGPGQQVTIDFSIEPTDGIG